MRSTGLHLAFQDEPTRPDEFAGGSWDGFSVECVRLHSARTFEYTWQGDANYLALHDIALADGEITIGGEVSANRTDLRDRLTFVPPDVKVSGWSQLAGNRHGYTALFFDPGLAEAEFERPVLGSGSRPMLYFENPHLMQTIQRVARLVSAPNDHDPLAAETFGLLALLQLYPSRELVTEPASGKLNLIHQGRIRDYIAANLHAAITLSDLAAVADLSRFHFTRSFTRTYGRPPHQHVLMHRIGLAATFLATTDVAIREIARLAGFSSQARLSTAFRRMIGQSPRSFRQAVR